jgi:predicted nuclease with TOPRIM domain
MPDITAISQALGAFKALKDIGEATIGLANAAAFRERQIEFQGKIIEAQSALMALQEEHALLVETIRDLEKEVANLKEWNSQKQDYELKDLGEDLPLIRLDRRNAAPIHCIIFVHNATTTGSALYSNERET